MKKLASLTLLTLISLLGVTSGSDDFASIYNSKSANATVTYYTSLTSLVDDSLPEYGRPSPYYNGMYHNVGNKAEPYGEVSVTTSGNFANSKLKDFVDLYNTLDQWKFEPYSLLDYTPNSKYTYFETLDRYASWNNSSTYYHWLYRDFNVYTSFPSNLSTIELILAPGDGDGVNSSWSSLALLDAFASDLMSQSTLSLINELESSTVFEIPIITIDEEVIFSLEIRAKMSYRYKLKEGCEFNFGNNSALSVSIPYKSYVGNINFLMPYKRQPYLPVSTLFDESLFLYSLYTNSPDSYINAIWIDNFDLGSRKITFAALPMNNNPVGFYYKINTLTLAIDYKATNVADIPATLYEIPQKTFDGYYSLRLTHYENDLLYFTLDFPTNFLPNKDLEASIILTQLEYSYTDFRGSGSYYTSNIYQSYDYTARYSINKFYARVKITYVPSTWEMLFFKWFNEQWTDIWLYFDEAHTRPIRNVLGFNVQYQVGGAISYANGSTSSQSTYIGEDNTSRLIVPDERINKYPMHSFTHDFTKEFVVREFTSWTPGGYGAIWCDHINNATGDNYNFSTGFCTAEHLHRPIYQVFNADDISGDMAFWDYVNLNQEFGISINSKSSDFTNEYKEAAEAIASSTSYTATNPQMKLYNRVHFNNWEYEGINFLTVPFVYYVDEAYVATLGSGYADGLHIVFKDDGSILGIFDQWGNLLPTYWAVYDPVSGDYIIFEDINGNKIMDDGEYKKPENIDTEYEDNEDPFQGFMSWLMGLLGTIGTTLLVIFFIVLGGIIIIALIFRKRDK